MNKKEDKRGKKEKQNDGVKRGRGMIVALYLGTRYLWHFHTRVTFLRMRSSLPKSNKGEVAF